MADAARFISPFRALTPCLWGCCLLALCGCVAPMPAASAASPGADAISAIAVEHDCSGCAAGSVLVLQRDGSASLTVVGKARHGTQDQVSRGRVSAQDFDTLARQVAGMRFFELADTYEDPSLQDGAWVTTSVTRSGETKRVLRRDAAGPATLKALEAAIDAAGAKARLIPPR